MSLTHGEGPGQADNLGHSVHAHINVCVCVFIPILLLLFSAVCQKQDYEDTVTLLIMCKVCLFIIINSNPVCVRRSRIKEATVTLLIMCKVCVPMSLFAFVCVFLFVCLCVCVCVSVCLTAWLQYVSNHTLNRSIICSPSTCGLKNYIVVGIRHTVAATVCLSVCLHYRQGLCLHSWSCVYLEGFFILSACLLQILCQIAPVFPSLR